MYKFHFRYTSTSQEYLGQAHWVKVTGTTSHVYLTECTFVDGLASIEKESCYLDVTVVHSYQCSVFKTFYAQIVLTVSENLFIS